VAKTSYIKSYRVAGVFYEITAKKCKKSFSRNALAIIGSAGYMLDRNVNQKIIFTNLVNRLFVNV